MDEIVNHSEKPVENISHKSLLVFSNELLYKLADAGYLEQLNEVRPDRKRTGHRVYYFDPDPEIEKIIKDYQNEKLKEKAEKQKENYISILSDADRQAIIDGVVKSLVKLDQIEQKTKSESGGKNAE
jgi:nickel-dependent lactate racemase